jgi:hypothetical protein
MKWTTTTAELNTDSHLKNSRNPLAAMETVSCELYFRAEPAAVIVAARHFCFSAYTNGPREFYVEIEAKWTKDNILWSYGVYIFREVFFS